MWFLFFEVDENLEEMMSIGEEFLESKAKSSSSFLSRSFYMVTNISFIWRQDENSLDVDEHDECEEWDE